MSTIPEQTYFPGCKVRLLLRLEDYGKRKIPETTPKKPRAVDATLDASKKLATGPDPRAPAGVRRLLIGTDAGGRTGGPQDQETSTDQLTWTIPSLIPRRCSVQLNGPRMADTATIDVRLTDFPLDPRCFKAIGAKIFIGCMPAEDFYAGVGGEVRQRGSSGTDGATAPLNLIGDDFVDANGVRRSNLRFEGFVDDFTDEWEENGVPMVRLVLRDNTQLLIDIEAPSGKPTLSKDKPFDEAIADYLAWFPSMRGMSVEYRFDRDDPDDRTPPTLKSALAGTAFQPQLGPPPSKSGGDSKLSIWDYLSDCANALGLAIYIEGSIIVIERYGTLISGKGRRQFDPFRGRTVDGKPIPIRRLIYGRNIRSMKVKRKFSGKRKPANIEVRCYLPQRKKDLVVRWPQKGNRITSALPGDGSDQQNWSVKKVTGVQNEVQLLVIAQSMYEQLNRNELGVELKTYSLASFGGGNSDPDILDLKFGDQFEVFLSRGEDEVSSFNQIETALLVRARGAKFLEQLGFSPGFAAAYERVYTSANFQSIFAAKTVSFDWDSDKPALDLGLTGINYIAVELDKPGKEAEKQKASQTNKVGKGP